MSLSAAVISFLDEREATYVVLTHPYSESAIDTARSARISPRELVKSIVLWNGTEYLMALIPAAYVLVLDLIDRENPGRHRLATEDELHMMFADCTDGAIPGFAQAYNLPMIWDYALREPEELYFEGGDHQTLIRMQRSDVVRMLDDYDGLIMSCTPDHIEYYQSLH